MGLQNATAVTTVPVTDIKRAKEFYTNKLGLKEVGRITPDGMHNEVVLQCGNDTYVCLYERPTPSGSSATACSFEVADVDRVVMELKHKGVSFEDYDMPELGIKTRDGIAATGGLKSAWCKDPDGNILAISNGLRMLREGRLETMQHA